MRDLQARLAASRCRSDELVTFSQSALSWAPLVLALALQVRRDPTLLDVAEHLQGQIQMQVKRYEGPVRIEDFAHQEWTRVRRANTGNWMCPN